MPGQRLSIRDHLKVPSNTDHPPVPAHFTRTSKTHLLPVPGNRNQESFRNLLSTTSTLGIGGFHQTRLSSYPFCIFLPRLFLHYSFEQPSCALHTGNGFVLFAVFRTVEDPERRGVPDAGTGKPGRARRAVWQFCGGRTSSPRVPPAGRKTPQ